MSASSQDLADGRKAMDELLCEWGVSLADDASTALVHRVAKWRDPRSGGSWKSCLRIEAGIALRMGALLQPPLKGEPGEPLHFDGRSGRYMIGESELHCGDVIQLFENGIWNETRIEHSNSAGGWYFVHVSPAAASQWEGVKARRAAWASTNTTAA